MNFLVVGDIVGKSGLNRLKKDYQDLVKKYSIEFTIVNGENSANGKGIRMTEYNELMSLGVDVITMGNHIYYRKEMAQEYIKLDRLLIPGNISNMKGNSSVIIEKNNLKIAVVNAIGKYSMGEMENYITNPFHFLEEEIKKVNENGADIIFVDFHGEVTAEKIAMSYFLQDKVTCLFGTHTHIQTSDEKILDGKMAYITDVGMTGPKQSVLGLKKEIALRRFLTGQYLKYECSENEAALNAIVVEVDENTKTASKIIRINNE